MSFNGWIKVHRKILDHWVSQEPELFAFWMRLLIEANHSDKKRIFNGALVEIRRGQTLFGLDAFESKSGISKKKLRRYLDMLESEGMIGRQKTNKYSLISILNYDDHQFEGSQEAGRGQAEGKQRASKGQHLENVKNDENVKKENIRAEPDPVAVEIINFLNEKTGKNYAAKKTNLEHINARMAEGYTLEQFKHAITVKVAEWKGTDMEKYLRPTTLFNSKKFDGYVNQPLPAKSKALPGDHQPTYNPGTESHHSLEPFT